MNGMRDFVCSRCNSKWSEDSGFHDPYSCPNCKSDSIQREEDDKDSQSCLGRQRGRYSE